MCNRSKKDSAPPLVANASPSSRLRSGIFALGSVQADGPDSTGRESFQMKLDEIQDAASSYLP